MGGSIIIPRTFPVTSHTDFVTNNTLFVAIKGHTDDGIKYCAQAITQGARTLVISYETEFPSELSDLIKKNNIIVKRVDNTRKALAELSALQAGFPARKLKIIGITGTKGKTTTAFLVEQILRTAGHRTALISSVKNKILDESFPAVHATPQPDYLHQFLRLAVENEVEYVVMEVAAQALSLFRVYGIIFDGIIFTNFSHEHLEFYETLDTYFEAKYSIIAQARKGAPLIVNADDERGAYIIKNSAHAIGYSLVVCRNGVVSYHVQHHEEIANRVAIAIEHNGVEKQFVCTSLFGRYNAYNVTSAVLMVQQLGISYDCIKNALLSFSGVPGRLEQYTMPNKSRCIIDYAHNPDSFHAILSTLRPLTEKLIVIFGAGGGRDPLKRPMMGAVASQYADIVIITSDNPRFEDPEVIADNIIAGIPTEKQKNVLRDLDRETAIKHAYTLSCQGTIIAILGKGHSEYQLIAAKKHLFSEKQIIQDLQSR